MEVREVVVVKEPKEGRLVSVYLSEQEVKTILSVGLNTMMSAGLIQIITKDDSPEGQEGTLQ